MKTRSKRLSRMASLLAVLLSCLLAGSVVAGGSVVNGPTVEVVPGTISWINHIAADSGRNCSPARVLLDSTGNAIVVGTFNSTADFGKGVVLTTSGNGTPYIA